VIRAPEDATPDDRVDEARRRIDALANRAFLSPLLRGRYDDDLLTDTAGVTDWSFLRPGDEEQIHQPIDVLGVNYYSTVTVKMWDGVSPRANADGHQSAGGTPWPGSDDVEFVVQAPPYTEMGWNIAPDGLEELLVSLQEQFPGQSLMITENGAAFADRVVETEAGKRVPDADRVDYLNRHFTAAHRAIVRGVPLHGYFVWSLMDNFEWGWGYTKRFGIVRVDYETQERIVKDSGRWLQQLIATRATPLVE
jgi:beta-glucosidase